MSFKLFILPRFVFHVGIILAIALPFILFSYYFLSKGPADWSACGFSEKVVQAKYGRFQKRLSVKVISFTPDSRANSKDGVYRIAFSNDENKGFVNCHYSAETGQFTVVSIDKSD
jgi:hypothetical protein